MTYTVAIALAFLETTIFTKRVVELLSDEELAKVQSQLLENPEAGDVVVGSGGLRKLRVRLKGGGKRGGARLIYYRITERQQIFLLLIYAKSEAEDLTAEQKRVLRVLVEAEISPEEES